jgi:hypothetical protein
MSSAGPPDNVKAAAAVVDQWVREQETRRLSADEITKLSPAARLDYTRAASNARKMPEWQDPRKG